MSHARGPVGAASLAIAVFALAGDARAGEGKGKVAKPAATAHVNNGGMMHAGGYGYNRNNNASPNQNTVAVIQNLHSTLRTLSQAQHDYSGHRVKAMHEIGTAIRHLESQSARNNQTNPATSYLSQGTRNVNGNGAAGRSNVPQTVSDQHLRTAMQNLNQIGSYVSNNGTAANHARALSSIQQAMRELNTALSIR